MLTRVLSWGAVGAIVSCLVPAAHGGSVPEMTWFRQIGTPVPDSGQDVAVDVAGNVYLTGTTRGDMSGAASGWRDHDVFLSRYDTAGNLAWTRQFGTSGDDISYGVAVDAAGNAYITGFSELDDELAHRQAFLTRYDAAGNLTWTRQFGTSGDDRGYDVTVDAAGNAYITGVVRAGGSDPYDAFLARYTAAGDLDWTRPFGTTRDDVGYGVTTDTAGHVYVTGASQGDLLGGASGQPGGVFLGRYDAAGNLDWGRQFGGSSADQGKSVAVDAAGNVYVAGDAGGVMPGASGEFLGLFLSRYDAAGHIVWTRQFGTPERDEIFDVAVDVAGRIYITGFTEGDLDGEEQAGDSGSAFLSRYDAAGNLEWTHLLGTVSGGQSYSLALDGAGHVYLTGVMDGLLSGGGAGDADAFLAQFSVPEPATGVLVLGGLVLVSARRRRPA